MSKYLVTISSENSTVISFPWTSFITPSPYFSWRIFWPTDDELFFSFDSWNPGEKSLVSKCYDPSSKNLLGKLYVVPPHKVLDQACDK